MRKESLDSFSKNVKTEKYKKIILLSIGILFILWSIGASANLIFTERYYDLLLFCYVLMMVLGFSIIFRSGWVLLGVINVLAFPLIIWNIDFWGYLLTGNFYLGLTNYFFSEDFNWVFRLISSQHLFTIPLSLYALYLIKLKRRDSWKFSFLITGFLYLATYLIVPNERNLNCIHRSCLSFTAPGYQILWFVFMVSTILGFNYLITRFKIFMN